MATTTDQHRTTTAPPTSTRLSKLNSNISYLLHGSSAPPSAVPASFRTRSALTTARYVLKFIFWRLVRWAKYAAIGAIVATLGTGLIGTLTTAGSIFIAPSALTGLGIGLAVGVAKFGYRHRPAMFRGWIPAFAGASGTTISHDTEVPERHGSFWSWASSRAHSGASPRQDEQRENDEVEQGMKRDVEELRTAENRSTRGDVWMRV